MKHWEKWPPTHMAMKMAWFKVESGSKSDKSLPEGGDVPAFVSMEAVSSGWVGAPPMRPADVIALAEKAKRNG